MIDTLHELPFVVLREGQNLRQIRRRAASGRVRIEGRKYRWLGKPRRSVLREGQGAVPASIAVAISAIRNTLRVLS